MRVCVDTSSLWKKYVEDDHSDLLAQHLNEADEVVVSPVTFLELTAVLTRQVYQKEISQSAADLLAREIAIDFDYFSVIEFNDNLCECGMKLLNKYQLKTLDTIQLASAVLSESGIFITSDLKLGKIAAREIKKVAIV
ncbi:MAG: type II toxin-antitoxin system VapC family toxin [Candidatus Omnitrophica bacterium]|nr:type II toxin-antitoxin system VapC family toxin [Candidatus Omnitrophota bacterium]